jgi:hypothetical protein
MLPASRAVHAVSLAEDTTQRRATGPETEGLETRSSVDHHELPTQRTALAARYVRVLVFCRSCHHQCDADLQALVDAGRGDVPLTHLRFRRGQCRTGNTNFVVMSRDNPQPW